MMMRVVMIIMLTSLNLSTGSEAAEDAHEGAGRADGNDGSHRLQDQAQDLGHAPRGVSRGILTVNKLLVVM